MRGIGNLIGLGKETILSHLSVGNSLNTLLQCDSSENHGAKLRQQVVEEQLTQEHLKSPIRVSGATGIALKMVVVCF